MVDMVLFVMVTVRSDRCGWCSSGVVEKDRRNSKTTPEVQEATIIPKTPTTPPA